MDMKLCKHFHECGGCRFQDIPYREQLARKESELAQWVSGANIPTQIKPINYAAEWFYRGKMEFSFAEQEGIVCGLYSKTQKRKVVDIQECLIFSPRVKDILRVIKEFVRGKNYPVYDKYSHQGFLRHLIVREAKFTNELMVGIVTAGSNMLDGQGLVAALLSLPEASAIKSVYWIINDSLSDAVVFEKKELLFGSPFITEELDGLTFRIGIDTFFQINSRLAADFYKKIKGCLNLSSAARVLDLFCGVGSIGIFLADKAKFVWGVEISKEIVDIAWQNAKANRIDNISFFVADARLFLNTQGAFYKNIDVLVVNPPRGGLSNKIIRGILRLNPPIIVYSSCNPAALFRDLEGLAGSYHLDSIEPFDFFPHTPHIECLGFLSKK